MFFTSPFLAAGLSGLVDTFRDDWIGPLFIGIVIVLAAVCLWKREFRALAGLAALATVVGLLIFATDDLFGSKDATLTGIANDAANEINTISVPYEGSPLELKL